MKYIRLRKTLLIITIVFMTLEVLALGTIGSAAVSAISGDKVVTEHIQGMSEEVFKTIVLPQMTRQLEQVRTAWTAYTETYDMDIMTNAKYLDMFLETSVRGIRSFGLTGDAFAFNSITGDYYLEYSTDITNKVNISNTPNDPQCQNKDGVSALIPYLMRETDILDSNYEVNLWEEPGLTFTQGKDFTAFKFGDYNREFVQKIMLPLPSVGKEQIVVVLGVKEKDIASALAPSVKTVENTSNTLREAISLLVVLTLLCMVGSVVIAVTENYILLRILCGGNRAGD